MTDLSLKAYNLVCYSGAKEDFFVIIFFLNLKFVCLLFWLQVLIECIKIKA